MQIRQRIVQNWNKNNIKNNKIDNIQKQSCLLENNNTWNIMHNV